MSEELEAKIRDRVVTSLDLSLTKLAKHIEILSHVHGDGKPISLRLAYSAAFYTVCCLLEEGRIILVEKNEN